LLLTAGRYQVDKDVLTTVSAQLYIDGAVEFVGSSGTRRTARKCSCR